MTTLGICIPTYKRPEFLRQCVLSAIASAGERPVHIFIADDSVTDINDAVLDDLTTSHSCIHVHRNTSNLGIDANIQQVVDLCDCDFAWLIGEDDRFLPNAIASMHDFIQGRNDPFVFSAYQHVSEDYAHIIDVVRASTPNEKASVASFVERDLWSIGFMGAVVVNRSAWAMTAAEPYLGTYFTHVGRILDMLASVESLPVHNTAGIANHAQGDDTFTWKKDSFGVFLGFGRMCEIAARRNPILAASIHDGAASFKRKLGYLSLKTSFRLRSEGAFDLSQFRTYILDSEIVEAWRKVWLLCLALTPRIVLKPCVWLYTKWIGWRQRKQLVDEQVAQ
jgi:glycosyltransferase involved in cell wall biosynthesis